MEEAPAVLAQALQGRIKSKENRGLVLLFLRFLVYLVLAAGIMELFRPDVLGKYVEYRPRLTHFSLALFGLVGIIFLLDVLTLLTWRGVRRARTELVDELSRRDSVARMLLLDPVTGRFDRRYLDEIIPRKTARADRREAGLSFVRLIVERLDAANDRLGFQTGERILQEVAQLIKRSFRPTDIIIRYGAAEFPVTMPETAKQGALAAVRRLLTKVYDWNRRKPIQGFDMELSVGVSDYEGHRRARRRGRRRK